MKDSKKKFNKEILSLFLVIISISLVFGCTSNSDNLKTYSVGNSKFQLSEKWNTNMNGSDSLLFTCKDLRAGNLIVRQMLDKSVYESDRDDIYNFNDKDPSFVIVEKSNKTFNNTNVELIKWNSSLSDFKTGYIYFFEKNNKYYKIIVNSMSELELEEIKFVDNAINTIVTTIN